MKNYVFILWVIPLLMGIASCSEQEVIIPTYIEIDNFELTTSAGEGASTSNITEVWVHANNVFIGVFPLPARIPVPMAGATNMRFEAGIRENGIYQTPDIYEFYAPVERSLDLVPDQTISLGSLPIQYSSATNFAFVEDFENNNSRIFIDTITGNTSIRIRSDNVRSGLQSGGVHLTSDNPIVEIGTGDYYRDLLDRSNPYVWLEVDFYSDAPVVWGIIGQEGTQTVRLFDPGFQARQEWTKIYFNLSEIIYLSELEEYQLVFSTTLPEGLDEADILLDNIKLLYF